MSRRVESNKLEFSLLLYVANKFAMTQGGAGWSSQIEPPVATWRTADGDGPYGSSVAHTKITSSDSGSWQEDPGVGTSVRTYHV
jgi:hypothetical protein